MGDVPKLEFQDLFHAVPCYVAVLNRDLEVIQTNRITDEHFGFHRGRKCFEVFKRAGEPCERCPAILTMNDGIIRKTESVIITAEGEEKTLLVTVRPIHDARGQIVAVMEVSTDITEREELLRALEAEKERRRRDFEHVKQLFDEVPCYVSVMDREYTILEANRLFVETFGEVPGARCYELFKNRTSPCDPCSVQQTFEDGLPHGHETRIRSRSGAEVDVVVRSAPIKGKDGQVRRVMELAADVTEVKDLQRELARLGKMSAHAAHNIKGILTGLKGGIFMVNEGKKRGDDPVVERGWEMVQRNVERIATQSLDILSFAKKRVPQPRDLDLHVLVEETFESLKRRAQEASVTLASDLDDGEGVVHADPVQMGRVLTVLVENAIEACSMVTDERSLRVTVRVREEGDGVRLEVSDNGIGIDAEDGQHIFEDFYSTKGSLGTGLGLVVVQKVISEHGGSVEFASQPGEGTTFTILLPGKD